MGRALGCCIRRRASPGGKSSKDFLIIAAGIQKILRRDGCGNDNPAGKAVILNVSDPVGPALFAGWFPAEQTADII